MKKLIFPVVVLLMMLVSSCSEKFDVAAPYKSITIVYGLLDMKDTAHYIRIEKAFLDQNKSAIAMAKVADSIYFDTLQVQLKQLNNGTVTSIITLAKVDMTNEGYPKEPGAFATSPSYAYKFKGFLDANYTYRLVIYNPKTGLSDSSETGVIDDVTPQVFAIRFFDPVSKPYVNGLDFAQTGPYSTFSIIGTYNASGTIHTNAVGIIQAIIRFRWIDSVYSGAETHQSSDFNMGIQTLDAGGGFNFTVNNTQLYSFLRQAMGPSPTGTYRIIDSCDIFVYAGTSDFATYQNVILAQQTGLTADQIQPNYTNIKGKDVLGLITTKGNVSGRAKLKSSTVDSLVHGVLLPEEHIIGTTTDR